MEISELKKRMDGAVSVLHQELAGLRTGRASADLLSPVQVDAYGAKMPINQVASVSVAGARSLSVQVWDAGQVSAVEKGIRDAGLGLNPSTEGNVIRINLPDLNEERRAELVKVARKYAEDARVSVRNVRRDGMEDVKKRQKDGEISEDEAHSLSDEVQKLTDKMVHEIDELLASKEKDIQQV